MLSSELRNKIIEFVEGKITISQLEDWLVPNLLTLIALPTSINADIASAIELGLAEFNSGLRTQEEFKYYLLEVLREETIQTTYPASIGQTFSSSSAVVSNQYKNIEASHVNNSEGNIIDWRRVEA